MTTGMRLTGGHGAISTDRLLIKPLCENLKLVYSPVTTTAREVAPAGGQCVVPLQNRYSFTDLAELTCRWQALAGGKVLAGGESHVARQAPLVGGRHVPRHSGHGYAAPGVHPPGRTQRVRRQFEGQRLRRGPTAKGES